MGKGISRAIHRKGKMSYRFCCRTALTRRLRSRFLGPFRPFAALQHHGSYLGLEPTCCGHRGIDAIDQSGSGSGAQCALYCNKGAPLNRQRLTASS